MKKNTFNVGIENFALDDLEHAQEGIMEVFKEILVMLNLTDVTFRLRGVITSFGSGTYSWTSGSIYYNGEVYLVDAGTLTTGLTPKWKIVTTLRSGNPVPHQDGGNKDVNVIRKMTLATDGTIETWSGIPLFSFPAGFSGNYADLSGKPILFSGNYADLSGKPSLFDGNYNSLSNKPISAPILLTSQAIFASKDNTPQGPGSWVAVTLDSSFQPISNLVLQLIGDVYHGSWHVGNGNWQFAGAIGPGDVYKAVAIQLPNAVKTSFNFRGSCDYAYGDNAGNDSANYPPNGQAFWRIDKINLNASGSPDWRSVLIIYKPVDFMVGQGDRFTIQCNFKAALE